MTNPSTRTSLAFVAFALIAFPSVTRAQTNSSAGRSPQALINDTPERRHALDVYRAGRLVDAMPLLESVAAQNTSDAQVLEAWAFSVLGYSATLSDPEM